MYMVRCYFQSGYTATLPHFSLLVLGDQVTIKVLQGDFGHGDPLLGVVTHGEAGALASHGHDVPAKGRQSAIKLSSLKFKTFKKASFAIIKIRQRKKKYCGDTPPSRSK